MAKIEVGMLVEIIAATSMKSGRIDHKSIGHIGKVLRPCSVHDDCWDIEGAERDYNGVEQSFSSRALRPIKPDNKAGSWDAQVFQDLGWNPSKLGVE